MSFGIKNHIICSIHSFTKEEVLQIHPAGNSLMDFSMLLVTDELLQLLVDQTNNNAVNILLTENTKEGSRTCKWKPLSISELLDFLGVSLHMGNVKYPHYNTTGRKNCCLRIEGERYWPALARCWVALESCAPAAIPQQTC